MTNSGYREHLDTLDRLLNDPDVELQPRLIWHLLSEISEHDPEGDADRGRDTETSPASID